MVWVNNDFTCSPSVEQSLWSQQPLCSKVQSYQIKIEEICNLMPWESVTTWKDSMHGRAREVLFSTDGAIVLPQGSVQLNAGPLSRGKLGLANVPNCARLRASNPYPVPDNKGCLRSKVMIRCIKKEVTWDVALRPANKSNCDPVAVAICDKGC